MRGGSRTRPATREHGARSLVGEDAPGVTGPGVVVEDEPEGAERPSSGDGLQQALTELAALDRSGELAHVVPGFA